MVTKIGVALGALSMLLGGLWVLQGLGVVHVRPTLCFVECATVQDASSAWAITGCLLIMAGALAIFVSLHRRAPRK
jgi:hypothetical protein